tara:strand:+ start:475 stop:663 length:189 start_codon:yes stop_codon:yes gene_type:complete
MLVILFVIKPYRVVASGIVKSGDFSAKPFIPNVVPSIRLKMTSWPVLPGANAGFWIIIKALF